MSAQPGNRRKLAEPVTKEDVKELPANARAITWSKPEVLASAGSAAVRSCAFAISIFESSGAVSVALSNGFVSALSRNFIE